MKREQFMMRAFVATQEMNPPSLRQLRKDARAFGFPLIIVRNFTPRDIKWMLVVSETGFDDICYQDKLPFGADEMKVSELCEWVALHPHVLRGVIVSDGILLTKGYNVHRREYLNHYELSESEGVVNATL